MAKKRKGKKLKKDLPEKFLERLTTIVGPSLFTEVRKTFVDKPTTFRVNTIKASRDDVKQILVRDGFKIQQVPWYLDAFILQNKSKRELTDHPLYVEGKLYCQSLASMVPPLVLDPKPGEKVLDLTAAPGSKTSQMAARMEQKGELVANELNKVRFFRLKHNMEGLGVIAEKDDWIFTLRMEDGSVLSLEYPEYFDKILVDAPCSGESRFIEGYPKTYGYWSEHKIKQVSYRQHKLIMAALSALKPGGTLVYSTCTIAPEENEARVSKIKERFGDSLEVVQPSLSGLKTISAVKEWKGKLYHPDVSKTLRILPTKEIEGFFVAQLKKK
ncbi:MAG: hypothetical protein COU35_04320 [Candidatus Magasanikbacteria bacterium CG10_big_fil_rev_8_21_14_0_10_47_10]|uniref:SAM-dependent MTase RsmB/NOP-type domain-containing protein n=1 Tax=Candidatus Magasanikbacteria bacterium CG10_big_fil_rev_8_21_14_0_10_47_10 TaxID=1974652 RepID=A0A2H0TPH9_9BACT|nr:MAG: hypothetical protein COU35_04320 [Candidatus Magasanikbacteria bacterium CG10_big_fil_rev_8_21_14_0_10_47_10]